MIYRSRGISRKFSAEWFKSRGFNIIFVTKVVVKVPAIVDHLFFLSLKKFCCSYNTSLRTIDALAPLSNDILIVHTLEFRFSSEAPELVCKFVEILPRSLGGKTVKTIKKNKIERYS